jgi:chemotaxis protein histidine kinase CheA
MAIVKKVIDDHKGKIEIDSEMGKGTTIRILLPL